MRVKTRQNTDHTDPLSAEQAKALLTSISVIRDPVHGDIRLTSLERSLIDTPEFQRLRHIKQLATVDLVYPGALHNRFLHSLGTLHTCSEMILACNNSKKMYMPTIIPVETPIPLRISHYAELTARISALLHDITHISCGHILHKELKVLKNDEWKDDWRVKKMIGSDSEVRRIIREFFVSFFGAEKNEKINLTQAQAIKAADSLINEVGMILKADSQEEILRLNYPFIHDLVGNTICADLLDYVQRDMYFCGLTEGLAKRFLQYLAIIPVKYEVDENQKPGPMRPYRTPDNLQFAFSREQTGKTVSTCRLVLLLYRYNSKGTLTFKNNILAEAIDLVRRRKTVAEKLYFHRTKMVASAMLAEALYSAGFDSAEELWDLSDLEMLKKVAAASQNFNVSGFNTPTEPALFKIKGKESSEQEINFLRASRLGQKLLERRLFKPIYRTSWHKPSDDPHSISLWHPSTGVYTRYCTPVKRETLIEQIEWAIGLFNKSPEQGIGTVAISCPDKKMQLKAFDMLVLFRPDDAELRRLEQTEQPIIMSEINVIKEGHKQLWALEVFVDPQKVPLGSLFARQLAGAIQHEIGLPNEMAEFIGEATNPIEDLIVRMHAKMVLDEKGLTNKIGYEQHEELVNSVHRSKSNDLERQILDTLKSMGLL